MKFAVILDQDATGMGTGLMCHAKDKVERGPGRVLSDELCGHDEAAGARVGRRDERLATVCDYAIGGPRRRINRRICLSVSTYRFRSAALSAVTATSRPTCFRRRSSSAMWTGCAAIWKGRRSRPMPWVGGSSGPWIRCTWEAGLRQSWRLPIWSDYSRRCARPSRLTAGYRNHGGVRAGNFVGGDD